MGEAKRRKKLDPNYGNIPSLTSRTQQQKHVDLVIDELSIEFEGEIKEISGAESIPDSYNSYKELVSDWLHPKLQQYLEGDRTFLASSIMTVYAEIAMEYETSPLLIKFWFEVLEPFLSEEKRDRISTIIEKINANFS